MMTLMEQIVSGWDDMRRESGAMLAGAALREIHEANRDLELEAEVLEFLATLLLVERRMDLGEREAYSLQMQADGLAEALEAKDMTQIIEGVAEWLVAAWDESRCMATPAAVEHKGAFQQMFRSLFHAYEKGLMDAWLPEEFCLEPGARKEFIRNLRKTMRMTAH